MLDTVDGEESCYTIKLTSHRAAQRRNRVELQVSDAVEEDKSFGRQQIEFEPTDCEIQSPPLGHQGPPFQQTLSGNPPAAHGPGCSPPESTFPRTGCHPFPQPLESTAPTPGGHLAFPSNPRCAPLRLNSTRSMFGGVHIDFRG